MNVRVKVDTNDTKLSEKIDTKSENLPKWTTAVEQPVFAWRPC